MKFIIHSASLRFLIFRNAQLKQIELTPPKRLPPDGISSLGVKQVGITTNGLVLRHRLQPLLDAGLTHLNVSLDTLVEPKFELITRRRGWKQVMAGIEAALQSRLTSVKVRSLE